MKVTPGGLIIPSSLEPRVPKFECLVCGEAVFYEDELSAYERHVARCAEEHRDEIQAASMRHEGPFAEDAGFDVEHERWARQHGRVK